LHEECSNKTECNVDWTPKTIYTKGIKTYDADSGVCGDLASLYVQYKCMIPKHLFVKR